NRRAKAKSHLRTMIVSLPIFSLTTHTSVQTTLDGPLQTILHHPNKSPIFTLNSIIPSLVAIPDSTHLLSNYTPSSVSSPKFYNSLLHLPTALPAFLMRFLIRRASLSRTETSPSSSTGTLCDSTLSFD